MKSNLCIVVTLDKVSTCQMWPTCGFINTITIHKVVIIIAFTNPEWQVGSCFYSYFYLLVLVAAPCTQLNHGPSHILVPILWTPPNLWSYGGSTSFQWGRAKQCMGMSVMTPDNTELHRWVYTNKPKISSIISQKWMILQYWSLWQRFLLG